MKRGTAEAARHRCGDLTRSGDHRLGWDGPLRHTARRPPIAGPSQLALPGGSRGGEQPCDDERSDDSEATLTCDHAHDSNVLPAAPASPDYCESGISPP
jgi:hypothetical protein